MLPRLLALVCSVLLVAPAIVHAQGKLLPADRPIEQAIDHYIDAALKDASVLAAAPADDAAILRRLTLDLVGRIPTLQEATDYAASKDADKKAQLVERLLAAPGHVRHQAQEFFALLQVQDVPGKAPKYSHLHDYLLTSFADNRSWDKIFRELLLPDAKDTTAKGADNFLKPRLKDQNRLTVDVSTLFLGVNISCAQCHDHPHVNAWTQDHFYGMKSFFARTVETGGFVAEKDFGAVKYLPNKGQEKLAPVMFLTGKTVDDPGMKEPTPQEKKKEQERLESAKKAKAAPAPPQFSLRAKFVQTALEPDQRHFFARAIVNRLWYRFFGRGLVMPLDQMHIENPATHPELLEWLARDLAEHGYDLRRLTRGLVLSNAYARSSKWGEGRLPDERLIAVAQVRPLTPMQMATSLRLATLAPESLPSATKELEQRLETLEKSAAKWAPAFPQPGEQFQVSVSEAMLFANNLALSKELFEGPGTLPARLLELKDEEARARLAVHAVLGRTATAEEVQALASYQRARQDRLESACQQIVWALLTSAEFRFNH